MQGLMMETPLLISSLIQHAGRYHTGTEIVTRMVEGPIHRYTYGEAHARSRKLAIGSMARDSTQRVAAGFGSFEHPGLGLARGPQAAH